MEILNNIWGALNSPNVYIINVFVVCAAVIENFLILCFINNLFSLNANKMQKLIFISIISIIAILGTFIIPTPFNIILNYFSIFIVIHFLFKPKFIHTIIMTFLPSIFFALIQSLILSPYLSLFNISYDDIYLIPIHRISFAFTGYFIIFLIILLLKYKNLKINIFDNFDKRNKFIIILNIIFGFIAIFAQFVLAITYMDKLSITFSIFNFASFLVYFILSVYSLTRVMKLADTTQKLVSAEEYNKTLHILHDNVRGFKHDFDNIVTTIGGYVKTNDMDGLKKYYFQLEEDCKKVNNLYVLNPDMINNPGIYNLLATKYNEALEKDIKINLTFLLDLNDLHMKIYEFTRILGILLDNAIEASSESDEKILYITFRKEHKNNMNLVMIENSYNEKDVDIDNIFNKGVSGKENHTGLGLWEVRQILKKNNNANLYTTKNDKLFTQKLEIYY